MRKLLTFLIAQHLKYLLVAVGLLFSSQANAASKFWNPYSVTGAVSGTGGVCRLTISPAIVGSGLTTANTVAVTSIVGATGCNVTATISTVVDTTHIELTGTTFGGTYTSGGCVAGGNWTATNTANWVSTTTTATCGSGGSAVPGSVDIPNFDVNSLAGTIVPDSDSSWSGATFLGMVTSTFTGTLDFSVSNPSFTIGVSSWIDANTGVHIINMGSGTWTFNGGAPSITTGANLTLNADTSTVLFSLSATASAGRSFNGGGKSWNIVTISGTNQNGTGVNLSGAPTIATLNLTNGAIFVPSNGTTTTITNAFNPTGTSSSPITIQGGSGGTAAIIIANGGASLTWVYLEHINFTGSSGAVNATNSFDGTGNNMNGGSITGPSGGAGGGRGIISAAP